MEKEQELGEQEALDNPPADETADRLPHPPIFRHEPADEPADEPSNIQERPQPSPGSEPAWEAGGNTDPPPQFLRRTATAVEDASDPPASSTLPAPPRTPADVGLSKAFLTDLVLKTIHYAGTLSTSQIMRRLGLGQPIIEQLLSALKEDRLVEVMSQSDLYTGNYRYRLSEKGGQRVSEALERSRYAGPAPVPAEQYAEVIRQQQANSQASSRGQIKEVLNELVLSPAVANAVARALYSGKASILYGPSGNGKTTILERFARNLEGTALVPYAIYAYGQVIRVFDQSIHNPLEDLDATNAMRDDSKMDRRWVLIRRPAVVMGAEIGRESLDMAYDPQSRFYQAPPHIKAQGGVLIVDDFGRQRIDARELLTRWLIPLERGWDTLSLITGEKLTLPFSAQLLLSTNLDIRQLADDALLRRILYKVEVPNPGREEFAEVLRQICRRKHILVSEGILDYVIQQLYSRPGMEPQASHARDLLDMVIESAAFDGRDPVLDRETFDRVAGMLAVHAADSEPAA